MKVILISIKLKPKVIYVHDFYLPLPGYMASLLTKAKFVYDAHELMIPSSFRLENLRQVLRHKFIYFCEKSSINKADLVIAANLERSKLMMEHYQLRYLPTVIRNIPPIPDTSIGIVELDKRYPELTRLDKSTIKLVYQGDMSSERGVGEFISAIGYFPENYRLILIGSGPDIDFLKRLTREKNLGKRTIFLGRIPEEHLFALLKLCDIGLITYSSDGLNNIYCAPNKVYEYAQAGLMTVATNQKTIVSIMERYRIGALLNKQEFRNDLSLLYRTVSTLNYNKDEIELFLTENSWTNERRILIGKLLNFIGK